MKEKKRYVGVVIKMGDKILLCKRNNKGSFPGMWSVPAGSIENGEKSRDAAIREFKEETHISLKPESLTFTGMVPRTSRDGKWVKGYMYVYLHEPENILFPDLENAVDGDEHSECGYFTWTQIKNMNTGTHLKNLLEVILGKI
jgi:ADP-ribose pyrophosphatase YjhB (NUDIX family)